MSPENDFQDDRRDDDFDDEKPRTMLEAYRDIRLSTSLEKASSSREAYNSTVNAITMGLSMLGSVLDEYTGQPYYSDDSDFVVDILQALKDIDIPQDTINCDDDSTDVTIDGVAKWSLQLGQNIPELRASIANERYDRAYLTASVILTKVEMRLYSHGILPKPSDDLRTYSMVTMYKNAALTDVRTRPEVEKALHERDMEIRQLRQKLAEAVESDG